MQPFDSSYEEACLLDPYDNHLRYINMTKTYLTNERQANRLDRPA